MGRIAALETKKATIERFAQVGPEKISPEARPLEVSQWQMAWDVVGQGIAAVNEEARVLRGKARDLEAEIAALERAARSPLDRGLRSATSLSRSRRRAPGQARSASPIVLAAPPGPRSTTRGSTLGGRAARRHSNLSDVPRSRSGRVRIGTTLPWHSQPSTQPVALHRLTFRPCKSNFMSRARSRVAGSQGRRVGR
jgi:hypothetical protein